MNRLSAAHPSGAVAAGESGPFAVVLLQPSHANGLIPAVPPLPPAIGAPPVCLTLPPEAGCGSSFPYKYTGVGPPSFVWLPEVGSGPVPLNLAIH